MLNKTGAYSVSPKGLLVLSTGRQKEELIPQRGRKFKGGKVLLHSVQTKDTILNKRPSGSRNLYYYLYY